MKRWRAAGLRTADSVFAPKGLPRCGIVFILGPMSPAFYHFVHAVGIICLFIGIGMGGSDAGRKCAMRWHGTGLLILLISGFGNVAKVLNNQFPTWVILKLVIWLVLGVLPVLVKRGKLSGTHGVLVAMLAGAAAAYLGAMKPVW